MNKANVTQFVANMRNSIEQHSPEILTGIGIAGMVTTTVLAVKATPKALELINDAASVKFEERDGEEMTKLEVVKAGWKPYIPAALSGAFSIACIIGAQSVNAKRNAALATAYKLSEDALMIYKDKVVETIGEKKEQVIQEKVDKEHLDRNPVTKNEVIITGIGEQLCYDVISGRYFKSDIETLRKVQNDLNAEMVSGAPYISLSEFYDAIGLAHTNVSDRLGWNLYQEGQIDIHFGSQITDDGRACIVVGYMVEPRYDFDKLL